MAKAKKVAWYRRYGMKKLLPGAVLVSIIVIMVAVSLVWTPFDPNAPDLFALGVGPLQTDRTGSFHLLGTDQLGRDMFSRIMVGGQLSLLIAILAVVGSSIIGTILGVVCGYKEGFVDHFFGVIVEIQHSIPMLLIIVLILTLFGSSTVVLAIGLALSEWFTIFRQVRAKTLVQKNQDYILATKVMGATNRRIVFKHLLPNVLPTTIVYTTLLVGTVILAEAGLSFLGLGVSRPYATWGRMVSDGQSQMATYWWISTFPAVFIAVFVIGVNLVGDGIRQILRME